MSRKAQRVDNIMRRVEALPGVAAAFASNFVPLDAGGGSGHAVVDGRAAPAGEEPEILFTAVTPHLYRTIGLSIVGAAISWMRKVRPARHQRRSDRRVEKPVAPKR